MLAGCRFFSALELERDRNFRSIAEANPTRRPFASNWTASSRAARSSSRRAGSGF